MDKLMDELYVIQKLNEKCKECVNLYMGMISDNRKYEDEFVNRYIGIYANILEISDTELISKIIEDNDNIAKVYEKLCKIREEKDKKLCQFTKSVFIARIGDEMLNSSIKRRLD